MSNNPPALHGRSTTTAEKSSSKTNDILHTERMAGLTLSDKQGETGQRTKIRPGGKTAKRRDSSSSGSSGPPEDTASTAAFDAAKAADLFLSSRIDRRAPGQQQQQQSTSSALISDDIDTRQFCMGYREVVKFIDQLGVAFQFIAKMMRGRLDYIENLVLTDNREIAERYRTVERMLQYDVAQGVKKTKKNCCSQELLHLNRSLVFMAAFTEQAFKLKDEDKLSGVAVDTYNSTLSKYHPFLVRKTIQIALWTLPNKKQMADLLGDLPYEKKVEQIAAMVEQQRAVYNTVDTLYTKHDLQSLA